MLISTYLLVLMALVLVSSKYRQRWILWIKQRLHIYVCMAKIKGPHAIPLLGSTYQFKFDRIAWMRHYNRMQNMMSLWLGPEPMILVGTPETAEAVLSNSMEIEKSNFYSILVPWLGDGLLISKGAKWRSRRKMLTPTFHYSILDAFVEVYNKQADTLVQVLEKVADTQETFDMYPFIKRCALDIICETAMGVTINAQTDFNSTYVNAVQDINDIAARYQRSPWMWVKPIFYALGYGYRYDECLKVLKGFTSQIIQERTNQLNDLAKHQNTTLSQPNTNGKKTAFLDLLLLMSEENKLTREDIADEVETVMFEGDNQTRPFTPEDLKMMPYFEMICKETLRLYPPVPCFARKLKNDVVAGNKTLPAGATAVVLAMAIHQHEQVYENPLTFDPDRFLPENVAKRHPYSFIPFSAGPRNCIGQRFALMEEKTVLAKVLLNYRIDSMESMETVVKDLPIN